MLEILLTKNNSGTPPAIPGKWTELEPMLNSNTYDGILANIDGYIHAINLRQQSVGRGSCSYYDHDANSWIVGTGVFNNGYSRSGIKTISAIKDGKRTAVFVGGSNVGNVPNSPLKAIGYFLGSKGNLSISNLTSTGFNSNYGPLLSPNTSYANDFVEIYGGSDTSGNLYDRYSLNIANDTLTKITNLVTMINRTNYGFYNYNNNDYVIMGNSSTSLFSREINRRNTVESVNINNDPNSPTARGSFAMIGLGKYIYILGGRTTGNVLLKEFVRFNIDTQAWDSLEWIDDSINGVVQSTTLVEKDGDIYALIGLRLFRYKPPLEV